MKRAARLFVFYAGLFGLWTLLAELKIWPPYLFPTPWGVGESLYAGFQDHSFLIAIAVSMRRVLIGYAISVVLGMILGLGKAAASNESRVFIVEDRGEFLGLLVDRVGEVLELDPNREEPLPVNIPASQARFFRGVYRADGHVIALLNPMTLLAESRA